MDKWDYMKLKIFCTTQETEEITHRVGENIRWLSIRERTDDQNIQGAQKTELPQNQ
jgi:hypothetical protein